MNLTKYRKETLIRYIEGRTPPSAERDVRRRLDWIEYELRTEEGLAEMDAINTRLEENPPIEEGLKLHRAFTHVMERMQAAQKTYDHALKTYRDDD